MSTNISKQKRDALLYKINQIKNYISAAPQDENTANLLTYIGELTKEINGKKYGLVFEEHREKIDELLEENAPVLVEQEDLFIDNGGEMNFLIEGDNLAALKLLEKTHKGKIDVIYIDPPYNTGNKDFIYDDDYVDSDDEFRHSKWLSFMEKRLKIAKKLLSDAGVIFISIDENEKNALKIQCDEYFGEENYIADFCWRKKTGANDSKDISVLTEYILCYTKNRKFTLEKDIWNHDSSTRDESRFKLSDEFESIRGKFYFDTLDRGGLQYSDSMNFGIEAPDGGIIYPNGRKTFFNDGWIWKWSKEKIQWGIKNKFLEFVESNKSSGSKYTIKYKVYQNVDNEGNLRKKIGRAYSNLILDPINQIGNSEINNIFHTPNVFSNPKPIGLINYLLLTINNKNSVILDFFAGSGTTGHAVMKLNAEDGGNRKFILCTNNENNICQDVTYQRLKTVITGKRKDGSDYEENYKASLKYFKIDYLPIKEKMYYEYADELLEHIKELVELENAIDFNTNKSVAIVLDDDELDDFIENIADYPKCKTLYMGHDVLTSYQQEQIIKAHGITINIVPNYYYRDLAN